jgi:hypothetical protein
MYANINLEFPEDLKKKIEDQTVKELTELLLEKDNKELERMIKDCVKGTIKAKINEILQCKDYRKVISEAIWQTLLKNIKIDAIAKDVSTSNDVVKNESLSLRGT